MRARRLRPILIGLLVAAAAPWASAPPAAAVSLGGGLAVRSVDLAGTTLVGACLELWTDAGDGARGTLVAGAARCDLATDASAALGPADGYVDGTTSWTGLAPGSYVVHEATSDSMQLEINGPVIDTDSDGVWEPIDNSWYVQAFNPTVLPGAYYLQAWAICAFTG